MRAQIVTSGLLDSVSPSQPDSIKSLLEKTGHKTTKTRFNKMVSSCSVALGSAYSLLWVVTYIHTRKNLATC